MRNRWLAPRAIKLHLLALLAVSACLALGWWQLGRALHDHNQLSWGYALEWPGFAGYAAWMWWKLLHQEPGFKPEADEPAETPESRASAPREPAGVPPQD